MDSKKDEILNYHKYKKQSITRGKMLWKNLFISLASKNVNTSKEPFPKAKNLYLCSSLAAELGQSNISAFQARSGLKWWYNLIKIILRYEPTAIQGLWSCLMRGGH